MNLGKCIVCSSLLDIRFKHQCQRSFICHFCNDVRWFKSTGSWDGTFYWTCFSCSGIHIPLYITWHRLFGFPSWISKKEWVKWEERVKSIL